MSGNRFTWVPQAHGYEVSREQLELGTDITEEIIWRYDPHPLVELLAEDSTEWEQFRLADGRTGKFRRVNNGDLQIMVDAPGVYDTLEFTRYFMNNRTESMTEPQRVDETDEETGIVTTRWVLDDGTESEFGPVELRLRQEIGELKLSGQLSGTLVSAAYALARKLDRDAGMATAAVARELREYVKMIEGAAGDSDETRSHRDDLSSPV